MRRFYEVKEEMDPRVKPEDDGIVIPAKAGTQLHNNIRNDEDIYDDDDEEENEREWCD